MDRIFSIVKHTALHLGEAILGLFISYFIFCSFENRLLWIEKILQKPYCDFILKHGAIITVFLVISLAILHCGSGQILKNNRIRQIYANICRLIFDKDLSKFSTPTDLIRVTLFKANKKCILNPIGRYQDKEPKNDCKSSFTPGKGAVGIAYETKTVVQQGIEPFNEDIPLEYYKESERVFNLKENKAKDLNIKSCSFICIPLRFYREDRPWGILAIDSK